MVNLKCYIFILAIVVFAKTIYSQKIDSIDEFKYPPSQYRPVPFWHLNGKLTKSEIQKQVADACKSGFGGVAVLPVTPGNQYPTNKPSPGMSPPYLSEQYFLRYQDIIAAAEANNANVILYDDIDFPSGTAGGKLHHSFPDAIRKVLIKSDTIITGGRQFSMSLQKGTLMAAVATNLTDSQRTDITSFAKNGTLIWQAPKGEWLLQIFSCQSANDKIVDFMDPDAVKKFIDFTYNEYAQRYGSYFGNVIKQTFFDDVGYVFMENGWTTSFNDKFKKRFNKNPAIYYPALWQDIGPETEAARVALFDTRAELLAEGFPKIVTEWANERNLKTSGHPPGNYEIQPVDMSFDIFKFYRYQDIPTMDAIFYHGHGREGFKLVSSSAIYYDKPVVAAEIYGAFLEEDFSEQTLFQAAMEIFARGINFLVPHGLWYDPKPTSVRIPPLVSPYSKKLAPSLKAFNDFAARSSMMLTGGSHVSEIGILYPIASLEGFYHFQAKENKKVGTYVPPGTDYLSIGDILTNKIHRDFTYIHPELFAGDRYEIEDKTIILDKKISTQQYKIMILPAGKVISYHTLKKLKRYFDEGGKVIATTLLPFKSAEFGMDSSVQTLIKEMFAIDPVRPMPVKQTDIITNRNQGMAFFLPTPDEQSIKKALDLFDNHPTIKFENNLVSDSSKGKFSYIHKIKNGKRLYYLANSMQKPINTIAYLKGKLKVQFWDPHSGIKKPIIDSTFKEFDGVTYTAVNLDLKGVESVFIVEL